MYHDNIIVVHHYTIIILYNIISIWGGEGTFPADCGNPCPEDTGQRTGRGAFRTVVHRG